MKPHPQFARPERARSLPLPRFWGEGRGEGKLAIALLALLSATALSGCGWFSSTKRAAPGPVQFTPTAQLATPWRANLGKAATPAFVPALRADVIYAATPEGEVAAHKSANGQGLWRVSVGERLSGGVGLGEDSVLVGTLKGQVIALDAAGKVRWRSQLSSEIAAAPQGAEGVVVARTTDGRIYGLEADSGKRRWVFQRALPALTLRYQPTVRMIPGGVLAGLPGGKLAFLNVSNGEVGWEGTVALPRGSTELERVADVVSVPVIDQERACAVAFQGRVACFELQSGNVVWGRDFSSSVSLAADERALYVVDEKGGVSAFLKATGASLWRQEKLRERVLSAPAVVGDRILVSDEKGVTYALAKADGALAAQAPGDGSALTGMSVLSARGAVAQTRNGNLIAFATN
jgi:outer membrane protein assembly factor BamB